jgi:phosphatidylglycerophosphate synthase
LKADPPILTPRSRGKWIAVVAIGLLTGVVVRQAWDRGFIVHVLLVAKAIVLAVWNMLRDFVAAWGEFLQFVLRQRG